MHQSTLMTRLRTPSYALALSLCAGTAAAQNDATLTPPAAPPPGYAAPARPAMPNSPPPSQASQAAATLPAQEPPLSAQGETMPQPDAAPSSAAASSAPGWPAPSGASAPPPSAATPPTSPRPQGPPGNTATPPYPPPGYPPYGRLGGEPEPEQGPEMRNGTWDPWAHPRPGRFEHEGFFLRLNIGPSFSTVSRPDYKWSGAGLAMGLSIGGALVENLILHVDFNSTLLPGPTQRVDGHKTNFDADIVFESMGLGVTYYIMPANVYVSGTVGLGVLVFESDDGQSKDTSAGLMLNGRVGKEWWVSHDWGVGIAGQVLFMRVKDYVDDAHMNALSFNLLFSATYN